jgi:two-component system NarL family sensor kinase
LVRQYEARGDLVIRADLDEIGHPEAQALLYRAARELLANVHKHARAETVTVRLRRQGDRTMLTVADDGTGFDPGIVAQAVSEGHIGLASLQVRIEAMGGTMTISSEIGFGTQITVIL